ncbi:MAG TPA: response regulator transcription factor [Anaerolineae bacterium]
MIRLIIVHQAHLICSLIASVLSEESDIYVIGYATNVEEALSKLERSNCNMILVAATLPDNGALELTKAVAERKSAVKVLVIGLPESENMILQYVAAGASGYVLQDVPVEKLLDNLRAVYDDKAIISPSVAAALMNRITELAQISSQTQVDPEAVHELTPREREVLDLIGQEATNQEIADKLFIEVGTVKNHVHSILKKLDVSSREEAASYLPYIKQREEGGEP